MATAAAARTSKERIFEWEGKDKNGKVVRGEMRAGGEAVVSASLRRQGILVTKVKKRRTSGGKSIKQKDIAIFTRQLATMMKAGVPLLQSFDIVARGSTNPRMTKLLNDIRSDVETGTSLSSAFRKHPMHFDALYCNLVEAGEAGGILERCSTAWRSTRKRRWPSSQDQVGADVPDRGAGGGLRGGDGDHDLRDPGLQGGVQVLRRRPAGAHAVGDRHVRVLRRLVVGDLRLIGGGGYFFMQSWKRSEKMQIAMDRLLLKIPVFGDLINKSVIARWTRTLSTMFAAGVPLVEALDSVGGASGNAVYAEATEQIQKDVSTGSALTTSMQATGVFPNMVLQMASIGEESGSLDHMLGKAAEFYEDEVDEMVKGLSSLMEPFIIVILGT
jgi:type IV pilus assembly protein PilC